MTGVEVIRRLVSTPLGMFDLIAVIVVVLCVAVIAMAIIVNFMEANRRPVVREKRSIVETGTMTLFFVFYYLAARLHIGALPQPTAAIHVVLVSLGTATILLGTIVNVRGRQTLGSNWANQIKMYENQTLVRTGPYRYVRHPLYASLIWAFFGGSILYLNWACFLLTLCIFLPFMTWRARQEEALLMRTFPEYEHYRETTGMFFPKLLGFHR